MKIAALALIFLWAAGCQAEPEKTDEPSKYELIRASVVTYLTKTKELAQNVVANLDDAEFKDFKVLFNQDLDTVEAHIKSVAEYLAPVRESVGPRIGDLISAGLENFSHDLDEVCKELDPKLAELHEALRMLHEQYRDFIDPVRQTIFNLNNLEILFNFLNVFMELRESPIVNAITNDIVHFLHKLDSTYGHDLYRDRKMIDRAIYPLVGQCKWLQPWRLPWI